MSIKVVLRISVAVLAVLTVSILLTLIITARQIKSATDDTVSADRIVSAASELNLLARTFARQTEEDTQMQWWDRYNSLTRLIARSSLESGGEEEHLKQLMTVNGGLGSLFYRILTYRGQARQEPPGARKDLYLESEERLTAQLLANTQSMVYEGGLIVREADAMILRVQDRAFSIVFVLVLALIADVLVTFYYLYRVTVRSLDALEEGAGVMAGGDLEHRVALAGPVEVVRLAGAFNTMGEKLKTYVDEQKKIEQQLQQAQKMEALGTLSGGIAHDFNNILAAIMGFTELAIEDVGERPERAFLENVLKAGARGKDLVRQIMTFSRRREVSAAPIAIGPVMEETVRLLRASIPATIQIRCTIPSQTLMVRSDPVKIQQVLMNLSLNGAYAMREKGGTLDIDVSEGKTGADPEQELVRISVRDTGTGMSEATMARIFDPFFTTKETGEGTGLGLSVVHGIVKDHGGAIEVESEPGRGSVFHVSLPLAAPLAEATEEAKEDCGRPGGGRVLLVDDEADFVEAEKGILERLGYSVVARSSSAEALSVFEKDCRAYDVVVTDQTMPGMTGTMLAGKIREKRDDLPIILCTGYGDAVSEEEALSLGIAEIVTKPVSRKQISEVIERALKKKPG